MRFKGAIFDVDGVLEYHGRALRGAGETIARLREMGVVLRFLTNSTLQSRASCSVRWPMWLRCSRAKNAGPETPSGRRILLTADGAKGDPVRRGGAAAGFPGGPGSDRRPARPRETANGRDSALEIPARFCYKNRTQ
jgi:hypothetical protein